MSKAFRRGVIVLLIVLLTLTFAFLSRNRAYAASYANRAATSSGTVGSSSYKISLFAKGTTAYYNPDPVVVDRNHVFVAYQNATKTDGSDGGSSTIVEYNKTGHVLEIFNIVGHCDGMRVDPTTHLVWALVNNDANPGLYIINPATEQVASYTFPTPAHGGGFDDLAFLNGMVFISASNPTNLTNGINTNPAVDELSLPTSGNTVTLTPVLYGNATAVDNTTGKTVTLNLLDPDSLSIDTAGEVVLVDQADSELVFLHDAGTSQQTVTVVPVGTQLDDTVWATSTGGHLVIVDSKLNAIYIVHSTFAVGTVYTEAPSDSSVASFVGTVDLTTGIITPVLTGFVSPTGMVFVP